MINLRNQVNQVNLWSYLTDEEKRGKIIEIINREEGIAMAVETLVNITQDEIEYARMCNLIKSQLDYQSGMVNAERKGRAEGIKEGLEKGREEVARNALVEGVPIELIKRISGLDEEALKHIQARL